jgi:hypothetical protein
VRGRCAGWRGCADADCYGVDLGRDVELELIVGFG